VSFDDSAPPDRPRLATVKRQAESEANAGGEHIMRYNARKQQVIRDIYPKRSWPQACFSNDGAAHK
jgi:hypothetical protein